MKSHFSLITSQDDPSDTQLSNLMSQVRQLAHNRVARVDSQLNEALIQALKAKKKSAVTRTPHNA